MDTQASPQVVKQEFELMNLIADRGIALADLHGYEYRKVDVMLDLIVTHTMVCPLRLRDFLAFDDGDFGHDFFGIHKYLDRDLKNPHMKDCFVPRSAR